MLAAVPAGLLAACDDAQRQRVQQVSAQLAGTWQHDEVDGGEQVRRTLQLGTDGRFTDTVRVQQQGGAAPKTVTYGGEWSYDGTNLKRRYLSENGRQFAGGGFRYSTQPLASVSSTELVLQDSAAKTADRYQRVATGPR